MSTAEAIYAVVPLLEANSEDGAFTRPLYLKRVSRGRYKRW